MPKLGHQKIKHALLSVQDKQGLLALAQTLHHWKVVLYGTDGTQAYLAQHQIPVENLASLTGPLSPLGGRVKTLHPNIFSSILYRRRVRKDMAEIKKRHLPSFDLVVVNLYPFEEALRAGRSEDELVEYIDIGGVALLRAAAKNFSHVAVLSKVNQYSLFTTWLNTQKGRLNVNQRRQLAGEAFAHTAQYDTIINTAFSQKQYLPLKENKDARVLRYGENPHQTAKYYGALDGLLQPVQGSVPSYNNLLDIEAALQLLDEFKGVCAFAIIKHTNPCGIAVGANAMAAFQRALAADKLSAFGGIFATNQTLSEDVAEALKHVFFELVIAPGYTSEALLALMENKKRKVMIQKRALPQTMLWRSALNGVLTQSPPPLIRSTQGWEIATTQKPSLAEKKDLLFALKVVKHVKSNAIVLARGGQMLGCGSGQTSRVDALQIAIRKAKRAGFDLKGAVLASEAFFPFTDCVEIAHQMGIHTFVQPGGSIGDKKVIQYCDEHKLAMCFTHQRYFKH